MHVKTRPEPNRLAGPASSAPPAPLDWLSETYSPIDLSPAIMAKKTVTSQSQVGPKHQELNPDPAPSDLHRGYPSWIQQLEQGVADYEQFMRWANRDPSRLYYTIVSAQAEYEKQQQQTAKLSNAFEVHRAPAVTEAAETAEVEHSAELMKTEYNDLKEKYDRVVEEAKDHAYALRRFRLDEPIRAGPGFASIETPNRSQPDQSTFAAESVEGDIEPRISKSTYLPDPERLDNGVNPSFESWLVDIQGKLVFNADHYPTEKHRIIYVACRTTGKAHVHLNTRLRQDTALPYTTAQDTFDDLEASFGTSSHEAKGFEEVSSSNDFHTFLCSFLYSSGAHGSRFEVLKHELAVRLPPNLKRVVASEFLDESVTFEQFTKICEHKSSQLQHERSKNRQKNGKKERKMSSPHKPSNDVPKTPDAPTPGTNDW
ncbi:unnamed protein product [Penicillium glandicola]